VYSVNLMSFSRQCIGEEGRSRFVGKKKRGGGGRGALYFNASLLPALEGGRKEVFLIKGKEGG